MIQHPKRFKEAKFPVDCFNRRLSSLPWQGECDLLGSSSLTSNGQGPSRRKHLLHFILNDPSQFGNQQRKEESGPVIPIVRAKAQGLLLWLNHTKLFTIYPDYQPKIQQHRHKLRARIARRACSACRPRTGDYETSARSADWSFSRQAHPFQPRRWSRPEAANLIFFGKKAGFAETED